MSRIKGRYVLLMAILGAFALLGGCSSGGGGSDFDDLGAGPSGGPGAVNLGAAGSFAVLAKDGISTISPSAITGDIGVSPAAATFITGFGLIMDVSNQWSTSPQVTGKVFAADYTDPTPSNMTTAVANMETAYTDAAGRTLPDYTELGAGQIGGLTLEPGLYKWGTGVLISTDVALWGSATATWIFQIGEGLTVENGVRVILAGGALAQNVFWQIGSAAVVGTTAHVEGTLLTQTAVTLATRATLNGRALAQSAVTLQSNTVTRP